MRKPYPPFLLIIITTFALLLAACQSSAQTAIIPTTQSAGAQPGGAQPTAGLPGTLPATLELTPNPATPARTASDTPATIPITPVTGEPYPAPPVTGVLATPESDSPAAGICDLVQDPLVIFEINPDVPSPRCAQAMPDQRVKVINRTDGLLQVSIAGFEVSLGPGEETVFDTPLGSYLAPGVHRVLTSAYGGGGPELWLLEASPTQPPYPAP